MACFLAPAGVAIVTTVIQKVVKKKEEAGRPDTGRTQKFTGKWTQRLRWLNTMLWGGVVLLCLEHIWHGEVVPWPPFLTAMKTPGDVGPMMHEILTYGVTMAVVVLVAWGVLVGIAAIVERRAKAEELHDAAPSESGQGA